MQMQTAKIDDQHYFVASERNKLTVYQVWWSKVLNRWFCTCPDFEHRRLKAGENCKHIKEILQ